MKNNDNMNMSIILLQTFIFIFSGEGIVVIGIYCLSAAIVLLSIQSAQSSLAE